MLYGVPVEATICQRQDPKARHERSGENAWCARDFSSGKHWKDFPFYTG